MKPCDTAATYDKIAHHWVGTGIPADNGLVQHERAFRFLGCVGSALDVGCGSNGRLIDLMLSHGLEVEGLDISGEMLTLARLKHPQVTFHLGDICAWEFGRQYDFISAWDSIWHVPLDRQPAVLEKLCAALNQGGVLIFSSGGVDCPGEVTNPCHGQPLYHAALGIPQLLRLVDAFGCVCRHLEYDQYPELHLFLIVQKPTKPAQHSADGHPTSGGEPASQSLSEAAPSGRH